MLFESFIARAREDRVNVCVWFPGTGDARVTCSLQEIKHLRDTRHRQLAAEVNAYVGGRPPLNAIVVLRIARNLSDLRGFPVGYEQDYLVRQEPLSARAYDRS